MRHFLFLLITFSLFSGCTTFNADKSKVSKLYKIKKVKFESYGDKLSGVLYLPGSFKKGQKLPALVVTGAWTTVKEQMPKTYAIELTKRGYIALTFDFRGWGESEGKERYLEDPERKTQDIVKAVQYLASRSEVDPNKIAGLGICASAGYMASAYTQTDKLQTIALVAPWLHNKELATQVYGGKKAVKGLVDLAKQADKEFKTTGKLSLAVAASSSDKNSIMYQAPYYTEKDRGLIKEYDNKFNIASWSRWLDYNAFESAKKLKSTILLVNSPAMALPQGSKNYAKIAGNKVNQVWLDNITQFDFYDKKEAVNTATSYAVKHFSKSFKKGQL